VADQASPARAFDFALSGLNVISLLLLPSGSRLPPQRTVIGATVLVLHLGQHRASEFASAVKYGSAQHPRCEVRALKIRAVFIPNLRALCGCAARDKFTSGGAQTALDFVLILGCPAEFRYCQM
jgi:hypothetical protein